MLGGILAFPFLLFIRQHGTRKACGAGATGGKKTAWRAGLIMPVSQHNKTTVRIG